MANNHLNSELLSLERKISLLLNEHRSLKSSLTQLQNQNKELQSQLSTKHDQINRFQNQIKISKIAGSVGADRGDASELKRMIDEYVDEIDRCIAHLSQ